MRGDVVPLTDSQRLYRARYLAQLVDSSGLDPYVTDPAPTCPDIYYRLRGRNGGKSPRAAHPADVWHETDAHGWIHERRTCDCSGANAWIHGHDRYQPDRMDLSVGYGGWFNTDSKIRDATRLVAPGSRPRCFEVVDRPEPGVIVVCASGSPGHAIGHEETVIEVPPEWDPEARECWIALVTSGIRASGSQANGPRAGVGWFRTGALFLRWR